MLESDPVTGITPNYLNYTEIDNLLDDGPVCSTVRSYRRINTINKLTFLILLLTLKFQLRVI